MIGTVQQMAYSRVASEEYQVRYMLTPLEGITCLVEVIVPLDLTQSDRIDVDHSYISLFNLLTSTLSLASMKTSL